MCPHCGRPAPLVFRGTGSYCTACGAARPPLTQKSVTFAGRPASVTGLLAKGFGWVVLFSGLLIAVVLASFFQWLMPAGVVGYALGFALAVASAITGALFLAGGGKLKKTGSEAQRRARVEAIRALASHRGGRVTAREVAQSINVAEPEADALLTELATEGREVSVDVGENGELWYRFGSAVLGERPPVRVAATAPAAVAADRPGVRVGPETPEVEELEVIQEMHSPGRMIH